jgi:hypothetical protein
LDNVAEGIERVAKELVSEASAEDVSMNTSITTRLGESIPQIVEADAKEGSAKERINSPEWAIFAGGEWTDRTFMGNGTSTVESHLGADPAAQD